MNTLNFFIGSSPSQAKRIINPEYPANGVMISVNVLSKRRSDFEAGDWIMDSGAFTQIARHGKYLMSVEEYCWQIERWRVCGNLLIAVSQDYMCEPFALAKTGLTVVEHQRLSIERYEQLLFLKPPVEIMPVLQGYQVSDYLKHLIDYGDRLKQGQWVGVGSVCRRNSDGKVIADLLKTIKLIRPDLRLHGFGLKSLALENEEVRNSLYSCDSMAWDYPRRFLGRIKGDLGIPSAENDFVRNHKKPTKSAETFDSESEQYCQPHEYQKKIHFQINGDSRGERKTPKTAGAGNGQGRKRKWSGETVARRFPKIFTNGKTIEDLEAIAKQWDCGE